MEKTISDHIARDIKKNRVILFMKGTKQMPLCGFSAKVVNLLKDLEIDFETRNVLEDDELRKGIKAYSNWPTLPQLYIHGTFIGGCDIVSELYESGELKELLVSQ